MQTPTRGFGSKPKSSLGEGEKFKLVYHQPVSGGTTGGIFSFEAEGKNKKERKFIFMANKRQCIALMKQYPDMYCEDPMIQFALRGTSDDRVELPDPSKLTVPQIMQALKDVGVVTNIRRPTQEEAIDLWNKSIAKIELPSAEEKILEPQQMTIATLMNAVRREIGDHEDLPKKPTKGQAVLLYRQFVLNDPEAMPKAAEE